MLSQEFDVVCLGGGVEAAAPDCSLHPASNGTSTSLNFPDACGGWLATSTTAKRPRQSRRPGPRCFVAKGG